jgi:predicted nucleic acid-binding protein
MARKGLHRAAGIVDLLTAAVAEFHGAVILDYDEDFETHRRRHQAASAVDLAERVARLMVHAAGGG